MDPKLEDLYSGQGAKIAAMLAYQCLSHQPKVRPTMSAVVKTLERLIEMKDILRHFSFQISIDFFTIYNDPDVLETNLAEEIENCEDWAPPTSGRCCSSSNFWLVGRLAVKIVANWLGF
uniref:Uncharacterized protein n=1 Tax=Opuntia streptacantha TaxID=393608 RepID=A0A7C9DAR6_OPUST